MRKCIIWYNPRRDVYYHKIINCYYHDYEYQIGSRNQYNHVIVHIIDDFDFLKKRFPIRKKVISKTITILRKYE